MIPILLIALALAMDAFAASLGQGAAARPAPTLGGALRIGTAFGVAQGVMPLLGWALGVAFAATIRDFDHWIAFALLGAIGGNMIIKGFRPAADDIPAAAPLFTGWALLAASIATSVDAAVVGVSIGLFDYPVIVVCAIIASVTFLLSSAGVLLGRSLGAVVGQRAEALGGAVLIGIGSKILIEHQFLGG